MRNPNKILDFSNHIAFEKVYSSSKKTVICIMESKVCKVYYVEAYSTYYVEFL